MSMRSTRRRILQFRSSGTDFSRAILSMSISEQDHAFWSAQHQVNSYLKVTRATREEHLYKQTRRGRPGPDTSYRKVTKRRFDVEWTIDEEAIAYDHKSDGMYPLI